MSGAANGAALFAQGITSAAANLSSAMAASKTQSSLTSVDQAGGKDGYVDLAVGLAKGKTASDKASIKEADGEQGYIAMNTALAKGKMGAMMETLSTYDSAEQYIQSQKKIAGAKVTADRTRLDLDNDQNLANNVVNRVVETAGKGYFGEEKKRKTQEAIKQLAEVGALKTDENGNVIHNADGSFKATTGTAFSNAFASLGALDMERGKQFMVAGTSMTMDRGRGGEVRITATSVDKLSRGDAGL